MTDTSKLADRARKEAAMLREIANSEARGVDWHANLNASADFLEALLTDLIEECAKLVERRMEQRFEEHGTREWDTNATYYQGAAAEIYESLDEEDEAIAQAIRNLKTRELYR